MSDLYTSSVVQEMRLTPAEVLFYKEEGYLPLPGLVRAQAVSALADNVWQALAAEGISREQMRRAAGSADKLRQTSKYLAGTPLNDLINSPRMVAVAAQLIGGRALRYMPFTAVKAGGGGGQFHFHQDNNYTRHEPALGSINIWVALVDMTPDNGCLLMVPRSHLHGQLQSRNSDDGDQHQQLDVDPLRAVPIRMRAGDAVAFSRLTVHGSGPNHTDEPRVAYALQFHREDVKWHDKADGQWKLLVETPRFSTAPLQKL